MLSRLFCWLWGHAWRVIQESGGPNPTSHVPLLCDRCGRSTICIPGLMDGREPKPVKATPLPVQDPARLVQQNLEHIQAWSVRVGNALQNLESRVERITADIKRRLTVLENLDTTNLVAATRALDRISALEAGQSVRLGQRNSLDTSRAFTGGWTSEPRKE